MKLKDHVYLMADYNQWMNQKTYEAVGTMTPEKLHEDQGAYFGSIFASLNHISVGDTLWLKRFEAVLQRYDAYAPIAALGCLNRLICFLPITLSTLKIVAYY